MYFLSYSCDYILSIHQNVCVGCLKEQKPRSPVFGVSDLPAQLQRLARILKFGM